MSFFRSLWRTSSKHKKLCEEWALANSCESVSGPSVTSAASSSSTASCSTACSASTSASASSSRSGPEDTENAPETTFTLKYLGSTLVESPSSETETAEAIKTVISMAKASGKKLQRVMLAVSLRGIRMVDLATEEDQLRVSIYRISYCSADAAHDHVFAFIATNLNETMECHAYLCPKRKVAQTVTLTVAQAFNTAYELWQLSQLDSKMYHAQDKSPKLTDDKKETDKKSSAKEEEEEEQSASKASPEKKSASQKSVLIEIPKESAVSAKVESWVSFDDDAPTAEEGGIPLRPLKSPTGNNNSILAETSPGRASPIGKHNNNNNNVVTPLEPKLQEAWTTQEQGKLELSS